MYRPHRVGGTNGPEAFAGREGAGAGLLRRERLSIQDTGAGAGGPILGRGRRVGRVCAVYRRFVGIIREVFAIGAAMLIVSTSLMAVEMDR